MKNNKRMEYYINVFLETTKIKNKQSTYTTYKYMINKHILLFFKDKYKNNIDISIILEFINELKSKNLKNKTIKDILLVLNEILKLANINIDIPYPKVIKKEIIVLSKKEQFLLEKELSTNINTIKLGIYLSLYTGIRIGELCALNINDIDLKKKKISIKHTLIRISNNGYRKTKSIIDTPKTINSIREIPIPKFLIPIIDNINYKDNTYILTNTTNYMDPKTLTYQYKKILEKIKINNYNFHTLRHTFATNCIEQNCNIKTLSEILGHSNISITLDRYVHPNFKSKEQLINNNKPLYTK